MDQQLELAVNQTITSYIKFINNPIDNYKKWENYGSFDVCRFCNILEVKNGLYLHNCKKCPIYDKTLSNIKFTKDSFITITNCCLGDMEKQQSKIITGIELLKGIKIVNFKTVKESIKEITFEQTVVVKIIKTLKKRLTAIVHRVIKNGYTVKYY